MEFRGWTHYLSLSLSNQLRLKAKFKWKMLFDKQHTTMPSNHQYVFASLHILVLRFFLTCLFTLCHMRRRFVGCRAKLILGLKMDDHKTCARSGKDFDLMKRLTLCVHLWQNQRCVSSEDYLCTPIKGPWIEEHVCKWQLASVSSPSHRCQQTWTWRPYKRKASGRC